MRSEPIEPGEEPKNLGSAFFVEPVRVAERSRETRAGETQAVAEKRKAEMVEVE